MKNHLRVVMARHRINNLTELMEITGLSRNALNKLWHDTDVEKWEKLFVKTIIRK
ncbi:helix-turn-helix domain-containing protein [Halalkalibacterium halodurans]|uniref:helix-turn-helix domain-containing protein n=1 Tax=Halalkalibacterium halodurans TaxID=86665 RepID=UPI002E237F1F|nr:helix-turn-helix domain-containing protein [Halalkalibacterium halodurans]